MAAIETGLALVASVALHVEYSRGVDPAELSQLTAEVSAAITRTSSRGVVIDELGTPCSSQTECVDAIATRSESEWVVLLRVIGVSSRIRLLAVAMQPGQPLARNAQVDLRRDSSTWATSLDPVLQGLLPAPQPVASAPPTLRPPAGPPPPRLDVSAAPVQVQADEGAISPWPWIAIGSGVVAGGIGAVLGVRAADARRAGEATYLPDDEFAQLEGRAISNGIAANVLFGAAAVGVVTGVALLVFD